MSILLSGSLISSITSQLANIESEMVEANQKMMDLQSFASNISDGSISMEDMMNKIAEYYEKEVDNQIKTISTIIEPLMMIALGIVAFILVGAILLPIYGLAGQTGIGG